MAPAELARGVARLVGRALGLVLKLPILFYRAAISPLMPPACRYQPTCSAYALAAIDTHGPFKGSWLALKRILRCHPIKFLGGGEGFDPVPPKHAHSHSHACGPDAAETTR